MVSAAPITAEGARPTQKIITPNGDGTNDLALFSFDHDESITVEIFSVQGHRVRSLIGAGQLSWDGRDNSGEIVESGVYMYQYKYKGSRISGLIAVAK